MKKLLSAVLVLAMVLGLGVGAGAYTSEDEHAINALAEARGCQSYNADTQDYFHGFCFMSYQMELMAVRLGIFNSVRGRFYFGAGYKFSLAKTRPGVDRDGFDYYRWTWELLETELDLISYDDAVQLLETDKLSKRIDDAVLINDAVALAWMQNTFYEDDLKIASEWATNYQAYYDLSIEMAAWAKSLGITNLMEVWGITDEIQKCIIDGAPGFSDHLNNLRAVFEEDKKQYELLDAIAEFHNEISAWLSTLDEAMLEKVYKAKSSEKLAKFDMDLDAYLTDRFSNDFYTYYPENPEGYVKVFQDATKYLQQYLDDLRKAFEDLKAEVGSADPGKPTKPTTGPEPSLIVKIWQAIVKYVFFGWLIALFR